MILYIIIVFIASSCTQNKSSQQVDVLADDTIATQVDQVEDVLDYDQSEGILVLGKLGEAYGNPPDVFGLTLDSPNIPDFIEGFYFDREHLIIQVTGDTVKARKILEETAGSNKFKLESIPASGYSQKQLFEIQNELSDRFIKMKEGRVKNNVTSFGVGAKFIEVNLMVNTPEKQQEFRDQLMNSPALRFVGPEIPPINNTVGVNDTLGIFIRPEYTVYSTSKEIITFILYNFSGDTIVSGESYIITYEDKPGTWRTLPGNYNFNALGYIIVDNKSHEVQARLFPDVFPNKSGRYRFHYDIRFKGESINMMAEFQLSDNEQVVKSAVKTPVPVHE